MQRVVKRIVRQRCRRVALQLESLEARCLLSISAGLDEQEPLAVAAIQAPAHFPLAVAASLAKVAALPTAPKDGPLPSGMPAELRNRVDEDVWSVLQDPSLGTAAVKPGAVRIDAAGRVQVYIRVPELGDQIVEQIEQLSVRVETASPAAGMVQAWISAADVDGVLAIDGVHDIRRVQYPIPRVTSAGDSIHQSDVVRASIAGLDGTGVKVGVISFGLDDLAVVGAEVPPVTVDPLHPAAAGDGNEGTAMLEIVHDVAPGAQLFFSAPDTSLQMLGAIDYLVNTAHVDVIVDDLGFLDQQFFEDGPIAQAAQAATAAGVVYVAAAGNDGVSHYQGRFQGGTLYPETHYFEVDVANIMFFTVPLGGVFDAVLQWSDPFGSAANDYDLAVSQFTGGGFELVASSTNEQDGSPGSDPFEEIRFTNTNPSTFFALQVSKFNGSPRELEFYMHGINGVDSTYTVAADSLFGASAADGIITVGAVNSTNTAAPDYYSSRGPVTTYTNYLTQAKVFRGALDGMSVDNVDTAVGLAGLFDSPFLGTSAAAPHVAGIVALMLQTKPSLTPAEVVTVLEGTATDLSPGGFDDATGAGLFDAYGAVLAVFTPDAPRLTTETDSGLSSSDGTTSNVDPVVSGSAPSGSYVRLFEDGFELTATQLAAGETQYFFPFAGLSEGVYQLTVDVAPSVFTPPAFRSVQSAPLTLTIDTTAPATPNAPDLDNAASDPNGDNVTTDPTPVFNVTGTGGEYWAIYRDGVEVSGPPILGDDGKVYKGPGNGSEALPTQGPGTFSFTVRTRDAAGNESEPSAALAVTIDVGPPGLEVTNTNDSGPGSLRAAIGGANAAAGADTIQFNVPTANPQIIQLTSPLPDLNDPATLSIDAGDDVAVGTAAGNFTFGNYPGLTLAGGGTLTIGGAAAHSAAASIAVDNGTLKLGASEHFGSVSVAAGGTLALLPAGGSVLQTEQLALDPAGVLDLGDNDLVVHATSGTRLAVYAQINALVSSGFANFTWLGLGIHSSAAAHDPSLLTAVGVTLNDNGLGGPFHVNFSGVPVNANDILVKYTYYGDADLSGLVDGTDYALTDNGYNAVLTGWFNGDFDFSPLIDGTDYALIDNSFNSAGGPLALTPAPPAVAVDPTSNRPPAPATPPIGLPSDFDPTGIDEGLLDLLTGPAGRKRRRF